MPTVGSDQPRTKPGDPRGRSQQHVPEADLKQGRQLSKEDWVPNDSRLTGASRERTSRTPTGRRSHSGDAEFVIATTPPGNFLFYKGTIFFKV